MARRSQCSSQGDNPLDPHYLPPHYREEYRLAVDALVEEDLPGYYEFLKCANVVEFLCPPEVEHIRRTAQFPSQNIQSGLPYLEEVDSASSDTYWPLHSDLDAPSLDLGWPAPRSFLGPTEVTMLVNPSDPNMPSIKEQARRLICNAQQVIAVVMDIFTDVDIFADLLDATMRNVAVYILLDELNAHYFTGMVASCKVNLERVHLMRIRTVSGSTYFCKTGKSFRGQMMDRFLLVDCKAVLGGNYSFMWSFEKIHRCIAHLFFGELVTTYDEEFRILYAQSQDLFSERALEKGPGESGYSSHTSQSFRGQLPIQSSRYASNLRQPFENKIDMDPNMLPFKRGEPFCSPLEPSQMQMYTTAYPSKHSRIEQSFMEQDRSIMPPWKMEMAHKRHSYAEGSRDSYGSSRQLLKHQLISNLEETQGTHLYKEQPYYPGVGPGSGHGINCNIKSRRYNQKDQYVDIGYPLELEPPGSHSPREDYLSPSSSKDIIHDSANEINPKRMSMNQSYICQTSPNQLNPSDLNPANTEARLNRQPQDPGSKQGLRNWRINSYLTTLNNEDEGLELPLGQDPFDEPPSFPEPKLSTTNPPIINFNTDEFPRITTSKEEVMPQYSRSNQPGMQKHPSEKHASKAADSKVTSEALELLSCTKNDKAGEVEVREPRGISIPVQEPFCSRTNPLLQRSSKLRSSLLFSSSNLEKKYSTIMKSASENLTEEGSDPLKTSSISKKEPMLTEVAEDKIAAQSSANVSLDASDSKSFKEGILKPQQDDQNMARDNDLYTDAQNTEKLEIQTASRHSATNMVPADQSKSTVVKEAINQKSKESTEVSSEKSLMDSLTKEKPKLSEMAKLKTPPEKKTIITAPTESLPLIPFFINMDEPEMRLLYFKQLAAERKAAKMSKESAVGPVLPENATDTSLPAASTSENLADTNMKLTDMSAMQKVPAVQEGTQSSTKTLIDKRPISSTSTEPISKKTDVSVAPELENKTPAVVKQPAESGPPFGDSKASDVRMVTKDNILKQSKVSQSLNMSCDENIHHDVTDTKKHEIKDATVPSASSMALVDLGKSLQNKPIDLNCDKSTGVQEAADPKSKKSSKDPQPKEESKLADMKPLRIVPEDGRVITAATESAANKPSECPKESAARGPDLSENITDSGLEISGTSSLNETNMEMTPANPIMPTKPISPKPECSVAPELENQTVAVVKKPAGLDLQSKDTVSSDNRKATEASPKLFERDILKQLEEFQNPKTCAKLKQDVNAMVRNSQNAVSVSGTIGDQKVAVVAEDKPISQTVSALPVCEKAPYLESQGHTEAKPATEIEITKGKEEKADHKILSAASKADQSRFQTSTNNVIYSCNLRDDTKVILEQISANSQNRIDLAKKGEGSTDDAKMGMMERSAVMEGRRPMPHQRGTRFQHTPVNPQERESVLKRMEKMRKEKKVYSRFEVLG